MVELTDSSYLKFLMSQNRRVRRAAFTKLYRGYEQFGNTIATVLNGFIKEKATLAKLREYESSLFASTFADEVTPEIYNNLIDTVNRNLEVLFDYYDLKREVLGLPKLHMYDAYAPLIADYDRDYTYEEARDEVLEAVKIFGDEYYQTLKAGMTEWGWVDVYPNKGKRGGAYSSGSYDTEPYILLNFNGKFDDMSTLAHEAGHSMHSYFRARTTSFICQTIIFSSPRSPRPSTSWYWPQRSSGNPKTTLKSFRYLTTSWRPSRAPCSGRPCSRSLSATYMRWSRQTSR